MISRGEEEKKNPKKNNITHIIFKVKNEGRKYDMKKGYGIEGYINYLDKGDHHQDPDGEENS